MQEGSKKKKKDQIDLTVQHTEHKVSEFLAKNQKTLIYVGLGAVLAILALFRIASGESSGSIETFITVENDVATLSKDPVKLTSIQKILKNYPTLNGRYDSEVAQSLIIIGEGEKATSFADKSIRRLKPYAPQRNLDYAKATLLIAEGKNNAALDLSKQLKERTIGQKNSFLTALNLLRIAVLEKDQASWTALKSYLDQPENRRVSEKVKQIFQDGKIDFDSYFTYIIS